MPIRPAPYEKYRTVLPRVVDAMRELGYEAQLFKILYVNDGRVNTPSDDFTAQQMGPERLALPNSYINGVIWRPDAPTLPGRGSAVLVEINLNFGNGIIVRNDFAHWLLSAVGLAEAGFKLPQQTEPAGMGAVYNTLAADMDELVQAIVKRATEGLPRSK